MKLKRKLAKIPSYSEELNLDLRKPSDRFKWFLASMLYAKRISSDIARRTYLLFETEKLTTPGALLDAGWDELVRVLDSGGYVRYDFSTAETLLETSERIKELGGLERIHKEAKDPRDFERRLRELKGIGPTAVNIFLRELRGIWAKAKPKASKLARELGKRLNLKEIESFESQLVKLKLEYCKRKKCFDCPVKEECEEPLVR